MFNGRTLQSLVPHDDPMILIDEPVDAGDGWARATVRIAEDSQFFRPGLGVPSWVGAEYMAQTVAFYAGTLSAKAGEEVKIGFLLGSRNYAAEADYFTLGSELSIHASEIWQDGQMGVYDCEIRDATNTLFASAKLNVFQPNDPIAFIEESRK